MLLELVMRGSYFNQEWLNRFNYVSTGTPAAVSLSFALVNAVGGVPDPQGTTNLPSGSMMEKIMSIMSDSSSLLSLEARAVYDVEDFYELPYVPQVPGGQTTGDAASPVLAYGFRTNRVRQDIRRGMKRFVGLTETLMDAGGDISSAGLASLESIATSMSQPVTYDDEGNTITFSPCVVSKEKYVVEDSGNDAYRYYPTLVEQMEHVALGIVWQPYNQVRTQGSRQYGRGV